MAHRDFFHFPKLRVHPFAVSGLFILLFVMPRAYTFAVLSSVLLHELGHLTASLLYHKPPRSIKIIATGINIELSPASSYAEEIVTCAAGPLMNLLYIAAASCFPSHLCETVRTVSLLLCLLNLLPLETFDGGRILGAFCSLFFSERLADDILQITTAFSLTVLWVLSLYIFFYSGINMTLLVFCAYLFSYLILKKACHGEKNMIK